MVASCKAYATIVIQSERLLRLRASLAFDCDGLLEGMEGYFSQITLLSSSIYLVLYLHTSFYYSSFTHLK